MERIVVRGSRFETATGSLFEPSGFHFVRRADAFNYVFSPPLYDIGLIRQTLFNIALHNFNVVRCFVGYLNITQTGAGHYPELIDNIASFLSTARSMGVYVLLECGNMPMFGSRYYIKASAGMRQDVDDIKNINFLVDSFAEFQAEEIVDLLNEVADRDPLCLEALFAIEIRNEAEFSAISPPFSQNAGVFRYHDVNYDLASPADRQSLMDVSVTYSVEVIAGKIRQSFPQILVSCSTLTPRIRKRMSPLDNMPGPTCIPVNALALANSNLDFIDIHYVEADDSSDLQSMEWASVQETGKAVLCGEFGTQGSTARETRRKLRDAGFAGCIYWDYDREFERHHSALSNNGAVFRDLMEHDKETFNLNGTVFVTNGNICAGFISESHRRAYVSIFGDGRSGSARPLTFPLAPLPEGYFEWNSTFFFTEGNGKFIGFLSQDGIQRHQHDHPTSSTFPKFSHDPNDFMTQMFPPLA
jgi:hypothetical protein